MAGIFHPTRGGTRGGQDQFNWEDVKTDKDREYYLGHSLKASVGKWQEGKDLFWYTRDQDKGGEKDEKRKKEIESVKNLEARAMAAALGHKSYSSAPTSITAKELQEALSHEPSGSKSENKQKMKRVEEWTEASQEVGDQRKKAKKMKREKKKKKKKKKRKRRESESSSTEDEDDKRGNRKTRTHSKNTDCDSDGYDRNIIETYRGSKDVETRIARLQKDSRNRDQSKCISAQYNDSEEEKFIGRSKLNEKDTAKFNQPQDSRVKFRPKEKRKRHDSSSDD